MDETSKQQVSETRHRAYDYEYQRGVSNLFMLFAPQGWRRVELRTGVPKSLGAGGQEVGGRGTRTKTGSY